MEDFETIYQTFFGDVYRYALRLCSNTALAEDLTSDTFLIAMQKIDSFRGECELRVWLCQILKNRYLDHLRRVQKQITIEPLPEVEDPQDIADSFAVRDQAMAAHRALHLLKEPYREIFSLRVFGCLGFKQIGDLFQKSENWACVTYHRARKMLRDSMEE